MKGKTFNKVETKRPHRSSHDLSQERNFDAEFGRLYPIYCEETIPGDTHNLSVDLLVRANPLIHPIMHECDVSVHTFFVPYRIIWDEWEEFITGGVDGDSEISLPVIPDNASIFAQSLGNYIYGIVKNANTTTKIHDLWIRAYNKIYNDYYRDENLIDEVDLTSMEFQNRAWTKDYFTSALPWQQRGQVQSLPIQVVNAYLTPSSSQLPFNYNMDVYAGVTPGGTRVLTGTTAGQPPGNTILPNGGGTFTPQQQLFVQSASPYDFTTGLISNLSIEVDALADITIPELRTTWQIQLFLENMAQVGARYAEYIRGIWHKDIGDKTLQRPEYIGGSKQPFMISEVLQTSESTDASKQGSMAGHGITADRTHMGKYHCQDWGVIMSIMSIRPKPVYMQGLRKQARGDRTRWDYPTPYTMHLSEQVIKRSELYFTGQPANDDAEFGFQMIWDEYRISNNMINGLMRQPPFDSWNLSRIFDNAPNLNKSFIEIDAITGGANNPLKRIFAVPSEPGFICHSSIRNHAIRPLPFMSTPGQVDH